MLTLVTGTPGSGKTLQTIDSLKKVTDRPIYYVGLKGLKLPWIEIKDPQNYQKELPDGSICVFDEVQQYFPLRAPKIPVPDGMKFIETHRHKGIDIFFITQHPNLLDHHARRLVGKHIHLQRNFGMNRAVRYTHNQLFDFKNYHELKNCTKEQYVFPKDVYGLYHSAEVHTVKRQLPKKLLLIPALLLLVIGSATYGYNTLFGTPEQTALTNTGIPITTNTLNPFQHQPQTRKSKNINWSTALTPALEGLPYTAPIYASIAKPKTLPIVAGCVTNKTRCQCYTQQGTRVTMTKELCNIVATKPQFNMFKEKARNRFAKQSNEKIRAAKGV